jgi:hypothetical protein
MTSNQFDHDHDHDHVPDRRPDPLQASSERTNASERSASSPRTGRLQLGIDFQPSDFSVICGRGKASYDHPGNHRLRMLASTFAADYSQAGRKLAKSAIVANIVDVIHKGGGVFCKYERDAWFEVGDDYAREKVSSLFRDKLARTKQNKTQTQHRQLVDGTGHSDDSSMPSPLWGNSTDSLGFENSLELDFFDIDEVF